jgi:hypothetical protein
MRSVSSIIPRISALLLMTIFSLHGFSQENSPYSRYGLGDIYPSQHIASRAMGGIAAGFVDGQSVNFVNPATYGSIRYVTYDLGISVDSRTLKRLTPLASYKSTNFIPSYVVLGVPLTQKRDLGLAFGLKPVTRISYSIESITRTAIDSLSTINEGSGGLNQVFAGIGKRWGGFSVGLNTGYQFGRKEINSRTEFLNDTVNYMKGLASSVTSFGSLFLEGGVQWNINLGKKANAQTKRTDYYLLRVGATGSLANKMNSSTDKNNQTYFYDQNGLTVKQDSVFEQKNIKGTIQYPAKLTAGFTFNKAVGDAQGTVDRWSIGADVVMQQWGSDYSFNGAKDKVINSMVLHVGGQLVPNALAGKSYWSRVTYRAGFFSGKDYINADGKELKTFGATFGAGLPIRKWRAYDNQFTLINTALEFGNRGTNINNIKETFFRFSLGLSLSDLWFIKRKYE